MKNLYPRLSRISLKDWLEYHPYIGEVSSDQFYISLCNDIQNEMLLVDVDDHLVGADYKYLACMLTCYFEDMISQTGIWTSFTNEHYKLYGKYLPFYDMDEYDHEEINLADIQFLIWHFCSNLSIQSHFIDPYSIENTEIALMVYAIMNEAVNHAPVNEDMKNALKLAPYSDIDQICEYLDFFFFGCYLNHYYMTSLMQEEILKVRNRKGSQKDINNRRVHLLFNRVSPLLAQQSKEMLANWIGESHPLYPSIMSISKLIEGFFLYIGATDTHFQMKHIASGILIDLIIPECIFPLLAGETIVRMSIIEWDYEWYAIGPVFQMNELKNVKIAESEKFLFDQTSSQLGIVKRLEECFLDYNNYSYILIIENKREAFILIDNIWDAYHLKYGMDNVDRRMFDINNLTFHVDDDLENLVVFFNPHAGIEFYPNIAQCISIWDNIFYDVYADINIEDLFLDEHVSSDFISFIIKNKMIEIEPLTGERGFHYVWDHCDFLLRYWKKERYQSEPELYLNED